jgi:hypothetical protein
VTVKLRRRSELRQAGDEVVPPVVLEAVIGVLDLRQGVAQTTTTTTMTTTMTIIHQGVAVDVRPVEEERLPLEANVAAAAAPQRLVNVNPVSFNVKTGLTMRYWCRWWG